jgi:hypothetical protein
MKYPLRREIRVFRNFPLLLLQLHPYLHLLSSTRRGNFSHENQSTHEFERAVSRDPGCSSLVPATGGPRALRHTRECRHRRSAANYWGSRPRLRHTQLDGSARCDRRYLRPPSRTRQFPALRRCRHNADTSARFRSDSRKRNHCWMCRLFDLCSLVRSSPVHQSISEDSVTAVFGDKQTTHASQAECHCCRRRCVRRMDCASSSRTRRTRDSARCLGAR